MRPSAGARTSRRLSVAFDRVPGGQRSCNLGAPFLLALVHGARPRQPADCSWAPLRVALEFLRLENTVQLVCLAAFVLDCGLRTFDVNEVTRAARIRAQAPPLPAGSRLLSTSLLPRRSSPSRSSVMPFPHSVPEAILCCAAYSVSTLAGFLSDTQASSPLFRVGLERRFRILFWDRDALRALCGVALAGAVRTACILFATQFTTLCRSRVGETEPSSPGPLEDSHLPPSPDPGIRDTRRPSDVPRRATFLSRRPSAGFSTAEPTLPLLSPPVAQEWLPEHRFGFLLYVDVPVRRWLLRLGCRPVRLLVCCSACSIGFWLAIQHPNGASKIEMGHVVRQSSWSRSVAWLRSGSR